MHGLRLLVATVCEGSVCYCSRGLILLLCLRIHFATIREGFRFVLLGSSFQLFLGFSVIVGVVIDAFQVHSQASVSDVAMSY